MGEARSATTSLLTVVLVATVLAVLPSVGHPGVAAAPPTAVSVPEYGYSERAYALPGYDPLDGYLLNLNGLDSQIPTLSSDSGQPFGIYYVNDSSDLTFLNLSTGIVDRVAHVVPLYERWGYNAMLDNEFWIEYGSDDALCFGTTTALGTEYSLELVNLRTGHLLMWNTTAPTDSVNQQALYVGNNTVIVLSSSDTAIGYNLKSRQSWTAGELSFFEANNVYWIPQLRQLISVQAQGSTEDQVEQLNATFDAEGHIHFEKAAQFAVDDDVRFNFVNGIGFDSALHEIAFSAGYFRGDSVFTYVLKYGSNGLLSSAGEVRYAVFKGSKQVAATVLEGQRYVYTSAYDLGDTLGGVQYLFDPWTGQTKTTNHTFLDAPCPNACFEGTYGRSSAYLLDFNATLSDNGTFDRVVYATHASATPDASSAANRAPSSLGPAPSGAGRFQNGQTPNDGVRIGRPVRSQNAGGAPRGR